MANGRDYKRVQSGGPAGSHGERLRRRPGGGGGSQTGSTQHTTRTNSSSKFSIPSLDLASINSSSKTRASDNGTDDARTRYTFSRSGSFVLDGLESLHLKVKQVSEKTR